jgi:hypothetical protein
MLAHVDATLRHLLVTSVPGLTSPQQVSFQPPDQDWRASLLTLNVGLNVYLIELRENRRLRSNERVPAFENGVVTSTPAPRRMDTHYLITAWSAATPVMEPAIEEHRLLYDAAAALMRREHLEPRAVFGGSFPPGFPAVLQDAQLPTTVLPPDGFAKYAEFWGTMAGALHPWKPAIYLVVTVPVLQVTEIDGPPVTTRTAFVAPTGLPPDVLVEIGGHVIDATVAPEVVVGGAWVRLETAAGDPLATGATNADGEFTFAGIRPGSYLLRWRAGARPAPPPRAITVPSPTGEYDLRFV